MQVILKEDIEKLGYEGDVVNVSKGYGRNYLIPKKKAVIASESALKMLEEDKRQRAHKFAKLKADAEAYAAQINGTSVTISIKVSEGGKAYGSVTAIHIHDALRDKGIDVDRRKILLEDPIKGLGTYKVKVRIYREVSAEIEVVVEAEEKAE